MYKPFSQKSEQEIREFYYEIWKARKEKGLPVFGTVEIPDHPLLSTSFSDDGHENIIEKVFLQWYGGFYLLTILYQHDGSHGTRCIGRWKQAWHPEAVVATAKMITNIQRVPLFDD